MAHNNISHEPQVKNIYLHSEIFSIENKYCTPTMKLRRLKVRKDFKTILETLYT